MPYCALLYPTVPYCTLLPQRFINHSCAPNLGMTTVRVDSVLPRFAFFALRDIEGGEELTFSYQGTQGAPEGAPEGASEGGVGGGVGVGGVLGGAMGGERDGGSSRKRPRLSEEGGREREERAMSERKEGSNGSDGSDGKARMEGRMPCLCSTPACSGWLPYDPILDE